MRFFQTTLLFALLLLVGCSVSNDDINPQTEEEGLGGLVIGVSQVATTRTAIDPSDNKSVTWCVGDQIAMWAEGVDDGQTYILGEMFQLKYYGSDFNIAEFASSSTASMQTSQNYKYSGFYPHSKATISGKSVTYTIPATQYGEYDGEYDYRIADSATSSALTTSLDSDCSLSFRSLTHALKVTIPYGHNLLEEEIKTLKICFPDGVNIVGSATLSMDATTTTPTLSSSGASNIVTLDLSSNPIDEGDCVWVFINPVAGVTGDIKFRGVSVSGETSYYYDIPVDGMDFAAGYITPINAEIGEQLPVTTIKLNITANNLGENLNTITITAPSGGIFKETGTSSKTIITTGVGEHTVSYTTEFYSDYFKGKSISVEYNSEHALITKSITLSSITDDSVNTINGTVPYLFEEDFSGLSSDFEEYTDPGGSSAGQKEVYLDDYGLSGWTADRAGGKSGALRTMCRLEGGMWVQELYQGRIDTAPLTNLKSGASVGISVTYKYSGSENEYSGSKNGTPQYTHGYTTTTGYIKGSNGIENTVGSTMEQGTDGSYTNVYKPGSYSVTSGITSSTRLSWRATVSRSSEFAQGGNYWLYLDNIQVQIK